MPDTRITELAALAGASLDTADDLVVVDVSDTTMAGTGTDKKITAGNLATGITPLLTYGTIATTPTAGNDSRLSDSRTPSGSAGGDLTGSFPSPTLATTGVGAGGPTGDATHVAQITYDAKGRLTTVSSVAITGSGIDTGAVPKSTVTTADDLIIATGNAAVTRLGKGTVGQALSAQTPLAYDYTHDSHMYLSPSGTLASTLDRSDVLTTSVSALTSGTLHLIGVGLIKGQILTSIWFRTGSSGITGPQNQIFGIWTSGLALARLTGDDGSTAWAAATIKTLTLSSQYTVPSSGFYYLGIMVKSSGSICTLNGTAGSAAAAAVTPIFNGNSTTGLSNIASFPDPVGAITADANYIWGGIS